MGSLKEKAKALLQQCEVVTLTSINKEGYPRPVPLSKIKTEGLTTIWFATGNWFIHHFPKGPEDPEYILLKFRGNHATIWIDGQFVHRKV